MAGVEGRVVVVTGAGGGLGRQHALLLASQGAKVAVNDVGDADAGPSGSMAEQVAGEIHDAGGGALANHDDVATSQGGRALIEQTLSRWGRVDGVVNNAGILRDVTLHKMTDVQWDAVLKVHAYGTFHVTRAAWPHLRAQQFGRVVVTSSTSGLYGNVGQANYATAKMGVLGLMAALAREGARHQITANAIVPLATTRMTAPLFDAETAERLDPAYVSPAVVHLVSEDCTDSGMAILAAGGSYRRVALFESPGASFEHVPTPAEVAARWDSITDLTGAAPGIAPL